MEVGGLFGGHIIVRVTVVRVTAAAQEGLSHAEMTW